MVARAGIAFCFLIGVAHAQAPDVRVKVDLIGSLRYERGGSSFLRGYDIYGRPGTVGLTLFLESGLRAFASQRIQRPDFGTDREVIDEIYVEDEGLWRVGKQYLPFGYRSTMAESAVAVRGDTNLIFEGLPIAIAFADAGRGRASGFAGRIGSSQLNASVMVGQNFGGAASSLGILRRPELAPGNGRGYGLIYGIESINRIGQYTLKLEGLVLSRGETELDEGQTIWDLSLARRLNRFDRAEIGFTRGVQSGTELVRFGATFRVDDRTTFEPVIRLRRGTYHDVAIQIRFRF